ncbi:uncharacterized protein LOC131928348 isoform X2 [Physella acuta]|uniref:uncharacterized protein LOC131928348 isoform X2 n=1 Tax=Physella acuta TaxID=109671 RepID=UPI0027DE4D80|nr:uncharacterized protein LOC131928348 isoform X2 [Physella acuta]
MRAHMRQTTVLTPQTFMPLIIMGGVCCKRKGEPFPGISKTEFESSYDVDEIESDGEYQPASFQDDDTYQSKGPSSPSHETTPAAPKVISEEKAAVKETKPKPKGKANPKANTKANPKAKPKANPKANPKPTPTQKAPSKKNTEKTSTKAPEDTTPPSTSESSSEGSSGDKELDVAALRKDVLKAHNKFRELHNAPPLKPSNELCRMAQTWADHLAKIGEMKHSDVQQRDGAGENIAAHSDLISGEEIVKMWYDEVEDYDFAKPGFSYDTGHFTQLVWVETAYVGFGASSVKGDDNMYKFVANYKPAGNYEGEFKKNVLPRK